MNFLPDEANEGTEGIQYVGVVAARFADEQPQLGVAVGANHAEDAGQNPNHEGHVDAPRLLEHPARGDEDPGPDDAPNYDRATLSI